MVGHYFGHEQRNLVGRVELARLFSGIGGKHADEVFVNEPQNVVVLPAVHGDDIYQLDKIADGLCLRAGAVAKLGKPGLQGIKNAVEDFFVRGVNEAAEGRERVAYIGHVKVSAHFKPGGKQVFVGDEVANVLLDGLDDTGVGFRQGLDVFSGALQNIADVLYFSIRKIFVEDKSKNIVFIFIRLNLGTHFVCGFPNL